jgi:hypothetical protein
MTDEIYVDGKVPAILRHTWGFQEQCPTLQEAVLAWYKLLGEDREGATIQVIEGDRPLYTAFEIQRLHYGPKPKE